MKPINLNDKLSHINETWNPKIIAELNGQFVKLAKIEGEFVWHKHNEEDELFMLLEGEMEMHYRDRIERVTQGEIIVVPKGVEHKPVAPNGASIMLFEPKSTLNTGDQQDERTRNNLEWL
jgi:mannose-6-phosphate isomerase-like protein (cupin superfamily)